MQILIIAVVSLAALLSARAAAAICPICTIAVAGGVGLSRWLGVDDTISGLWIGGLTVSVIGWTIDWLHSKNWLTTWSRWLTIVGYYVLLIAPLWWTHFFGAPLSAAPWLGVDKLLLGIIVGSIFFWTAVEWHWWLKERHGGRVYFPLQKVVLPVGALLLLTAIFYWMIKIN